MRMDEITRENLEYLNNQVRLMNEISQGLVSELRAVVGKMKQTDIEVARLNKRIEILEDEISAQKSGRRL
jgi:signal transduction histidine kinase